MSEPLWRERIVDQLVDDGSDIGGLMVVDDLLRALGDDLYAPGDPPTPEFLASLVAAVPQPRRAARRGARVAIATGVLVFAATGSAAAASGSLPDPIQSVVHDVVDVVGLSVPDATPAVARTSDGGSGGRGDGGSAGEEEPWRSGQVPQGADDPGQPGVGPDGVPPGQVDNPNSDPGGIDNPNAGGGNPNAGGANSNAGGNGNGNANPNVGGGNPNVAGANPNASGNENPHAGGGNPNAGGANANGSGTAEG